MIDAVVDYTVVDYLAGGDVDIADTLADLAVIAIVAGVIVADVMVIWC
jgi:hypothetical protein